MIKLSDRRLARNIFAEMEHHLVIPSILEGMTESPVYVDDLAHPQVAVTWNNRRIYLAGYPDSDLSNSILHILKAEIIPSLQAKGYTSLVAYFSPDSWEVKLEEFFASHRVKAIVRHYYSTSNRVPIQDAFVSEGVRLETVGPDLKDSGLQNVGPLLDEVKSEGSIEDFLRFNFGFYLVVGDEIVSWCLSEYTCEGRCEVGIETVEGHMRRGYGTLTGFALINHAVSQGLTVGWHCWAQNKPSNALALKLGLHKKAEYPVLVVHLK